MSVQTQINRIKAARDNIAAKIRARGVSVPTDTKLDELPDFVDDIPSGVELPSLTNEGTAADLLSGKQLIDSDGEVVTGTIATKTSSNLTASGATVTVPAGYYASQASKAVASGSAKTPATTVTKNPSISVSSSGLITASVSGTQSVTPTVTAGYVSSGTAGTITVSGSATKQLTTQAAQTITPGTSNKTIASGRYLTGTQTIKGDSNLVAGNIKSGISIFGVTGTYAGSSEDLSSELTEQANLIAQQQTLISNLETALENKAGGGGGSVTQGTFTVVDNGMYEPTMNEVVLSADNLNSSTRNVILLFVAGALSITIYRVNTNESFECALSKDPVLYQSHMAIYENKITCVLDATYINYDITFIAY